MGQIYDVAIIGGGINGCGCAADAALRGLSVFLCEQDDLASHTSSSSTKLIHGGLRYLEHYDFSMVKKALDERQLLLKSAPHLIHPLPLFLPYQKNMRPAWLIRLGLFIYDHLNRNNTLPKSQLLRRQKNLYFNPLQSAYHKGFLFYDCTTDDARLTITNAILAKQNGAQICTRTRLVKAETQNGHWLLTLANSKHHLFTIQAKTIVNATGPWADGVNHLLNLTNNQQLSLIKGSHIVVDKLYDGEHAYFLQHSDQRLVFVIPYFNYTMIGTTDVPYSGDKSAVHIDSAEIDYLLSIVNSYFNKTLQAHDIIDSWSGLRPLLAEHGKSPQTLSRDFSWHLFQSPAPAVAIFGGKITTYRKLSKIVIDTLRPFLPQMSDSQSEHIILPGGDWNGKAFCEYEKMAQDKYGGLNKALLQRYLNQYGTRTDDILNNAQTSTDLGEHFGQTLYQAEVDYLLDEEWAQTAEDILMRRTKLGLNATDSTKSALETYLQSRKN